MIGKVDYGDLALASLMANPNKNHMVIFGSRRRGMFYWLQVTDKIKELGLENLRINFTNLTVTAPEGGHLILTSIESQYDRDRILGYQLETLDFEDVRQLTLQQPTTVRYELVDWLNHFKASRVGR